MFMLPDAKFRDILGAAELIDISPHIAPAGQHFISISLAVTAIDRVPSPASR
jgi:hypothetical protein